MELFSVTTIKSHCFYSVKDIVHERTWLKGSIFNVEVCTCLITVLLLLFMTFRLSVLLRLEVVTMLKS